MIKVVGIRFRHSKVLWFDPGDCDPQAGDHVIVTTKRGTEMGECVQPTWEVTKKELPAPLKPVLRIATDEDFHTDKDHQDEERAAIPVFREYIEKNNLDMKPADVEVIFRKEKMIFYFSAEERIDFRQLVRDLAAHFHCRIEMRQVGVRDEARMAGGIAHCGEVLCCSRLGGEFAPVSIKMAKDQGLPLNPSKISGVCGRLMCCLRYEAEAYKDFNKRAPKKGAIIDTPRGGGKVVDRDALRETVKLQFRSDDAEKPGDTMMVPLARMCCKDEPRSSKRKRRNDASDNNNGKSDAQGSRSSKGGCGGCPCAIAPDVFEDLVEESKQVKSSALSPDGLDFRGLSSTQDTDSAIDNGKEPAKRKKRPKRNRGNKGGKGAAGKDSRSKDGQKGGRRGEQKGQSNESPKDKGDNKEGRKHSGSRNKSRRRNKPKNRGQKQQQQQAQSAPAAETRVPRRRNRTS